MTTTQNYSNQIKNFFTKKTVAIVCLSVHDNV